jgi:hypothetical protein
MLSALCLADTPQKEYIEKYSDLAVKEMYRSGVPASITLAQGLLESGYGLSELAVKGNNHFGINCHNAWTGAKVYHDDDAKGECFRKYNDPEESYRDHSDFLRYRDRYKYLFEFEITDYKSWAHGLKACGYATDPSYPEKLIRLIELYDLQKLTFDKSLVGAGFVKQSDTTWVDTESDVIAHAAMGGVSDYVYPPMEDLELYNNHPSGYRNGVRYIVAGPNETFASLALFLNMYERTLRKYNDALDTRELREGDIVYIYPKKNRAAKRYPYCYFRGEDTAWDIAQKYGIKLKSLYKLNAIPYGTPLTTHQRLDLR